MSIERLVRKEIRGPWRVRATRLRFEAPADMISLAAGDPPFLLPKYVADAVNDAILKGYTHYCFGGDRELKLAISKYYSKYGYDADPNKQVLLTNGGSGSLYKAYGSILNPGDEVIALDPAFGGGSRPPSYFGAKTVFAPMKKLAEGRFRFDEEALKDAITEKTKAMYFENPGNPSGIVYKKGELKAIADLAKDHDFVVVADEIYTEFIWGGREHFPIITLPGMEDRTIVVMALTKMFAWAGMRTGWLISGPDLAQYVSRSPDSSVSWPIQKGAIAALTGSWDYVEGMAKEYEERIDYCVERLNEMPGVSCVKPEGAFYLFPDISGTGLSSDDFAKRFMEEERVRIVSGSGYGPSMGKGHVRMSMVTPLSTQKMPSWLKVEPNTSLEAAMDRLESFTKRLAG
jgi:aspartate/methionine/tyrosine aminotransferase